MNLGRRLGWYAVVVGLVIAFLLASALLRSHQVDQRVVAEGLRVEAVVVGKRVAGGRGSTANAISYRIGGVEYLGTYRCRNCAPDGQVLYIYVDDRNPRRFVTESGTTSANWTGYAWAFLIVGGGAVVVGAVRLVVVTVRERYQRRGSGR